MRQNFVLFLCFGFKFLILASRFFTYDLPSLKPGEAKKKYSKYSKKSAEDVCMIYSVNG